MAVLVVDRRKKPLMPCSEKRARLLLERGRAVVHRRYPFTIRLKDRLRENSEVQPVRITVAPGSKTTGIALVREDEAIDPDTGKEIKTRAVLILLELNHRGQRIRNRLAARRAFRRRRRGNLRYREPRFNNRTRPEGWLPPSLQHRVDTTTAWVNRLARWAPVTGISQNLLCFDTQKMQNPEISGIEYQQGTLAGYETRQYLLEKWGRKCAYCGTENVPLEIEHIRPRSKGGSDRISNLTLACQSCNQVKGNRPVEEFLAHDPVRLGKILAQSKRPLRDAAAINSTRWALFTRLRDTGLSVEVSTDERAKWNRRRLGIPRARCLDAACAGKMDSLEDWQRPVLTVKATGRGAYQRTRLNRYGFPRGYLMRQKQVFGFQTGDMVRAKVPKGKNTGTHTGRVAVRASGSFDIQTTQGAVQGISHRYCTLIQRADGYGYSWTKIALN